MFQALLSLLQWLNPDNRMRSRLQLFLADGRAENLPFNAIHPDEIAQVWQMMLSPNQFKAGINDHAVAASAAVAQQRLRDIARKLQHNGEEVRELYFASADQSGAACKQFVHPIGLIKLHNLSDQAAREIYAPIQAIRRAPPWQWLMVLLSDWREEPIVTAPKTSIAPKRIAVADSASLLDNLLTATPAPKRSAQPVSVPRQPQYPAPIQVQAPQQATLDTIAPIVEERQTEREERITRPIVVSEPVEESTVVVEDDDFSLDDVLDELEESCTPQIEFVHQETPRDHIRLGETSEGQVVSFPISALGGAMVVAFGIPRTGKTTSLESLVYQSSKLGLPWCITYDQKSEWRGLRHGSDALPFLIGGANQYADVRLPTFGLDPEFESEDETEEHVKANLRAWARLATWGLENGQSVILDSGSVDIGTTGRRDILRTVSIHLNRTAQQLRRPYGVLIDEAQDAWPQGYLSGRDLEAAMSIVRTAPSYGLTTVLAAHRPTDVDKRLLAPARLRILHRVDMVRDLNAYADMLPWSAKQVNDTTSALRPGESIVYGSALGISEPVVVKMDAAPTYHVGYTPAVGVTPPREPERLELSQTLIESASEICRGVVATKSLPPKKWTDKQIREAAAQLATTIGKQLPMDKADLADQRVTIIAKTLAKHGAPVVQIADVLFAGVGGGRFRTEISRVINA